MSVYYEYVEAIGTWCANSPLWPGINVCHLQRPDIRALSSQFTEGSLLANEEESIYGRSAALNGANHPALSTFRNMTNHFDVVPVRSNDECSIVV